MHPILSRTAGFLFFRLALIVFLVAIDAPVALAQDQPWKKLHLAPRMLIRIAALFALGVAVCTAARAQCPAPWGNQGSNSIYGTIFATGSGTTTKQGFTSSVNQIMAAGVEMTGSPCAWNTATGATGVFLFADSLAGPCEIYEKTYDGLDTVTGGGVGPLYAFLFYSSTTQGSSYEVGVDGSADATYTWDHSGNGCDSGSIFEHDEGWGPYTGFTTGPISASGGSSLSGSFPYDAAPGDLDDLDAIANWNYTWSFSLTPDDSCKSCKDQGGSTVSLQSQSLGEDIRIVGTPFSLHYESGRAPGRAGADAIAIADARSLGGWTLDVHHALEPLIQSFCLGCTSYAVYPKALFLGDGTSRGDSDVQTPVFYNGNILLTSEDGSEVYVFKGYLHTQTLQPLTGAVLYTFGYDSNYFLTTVTDNSGNVTTIQRDSNEHPTAIVSPYGQVTTLKLDPNGYLSEVTDPAGHSIKLVSSSLGLLSNFTDADGHEHKFEYDSNGSLQKDSDPAGGSLTLARTNDSSGYTTTETTALGVTSSYQVAFPTVTGATSSQQFTNTLASGLKSTETDTQTTGTTTTAITLPEDASIDSTQGPDPRWGIQAPLTSSGTVKAGGLTATVTETRSATLRIKDDPFSVTTLSEDLTVKGNSFSSVFTGSNRTFLNTTAGDRKLTEVLDSKERISSEKLAGLLPVDFTYDSRGRLSQVAQGARTVKLTYDSDGYVATATDPMGNENQFAWDADGNLATETLPDGRIIRYEHDANGNLTGITPPGKSLHEIGYTPVDLMSTYTPPRVTGGGPTAFTYSEDRNLTRIARPDGKTLVYDYDSAGRLKSVALASNTITYSYDPKTGNINSENGTNGENLAYEYNGPFPASTQWTGSVNGKLALTYNDNFWIASQAIDGGQAIDYMYDKDGLPTKAGELTLDFSPENGLLSSTALGHATDSYEYDTFGEMTSYTAEFNGNDLYKATYTPDADGRVSSRTETIGGKTSTYGYSYDRAGRLSSVSENGKVVSTYTYDSNSNRTKAVTAAGTTIGTYDAQDRMLDYGAAKYTYTANGELATMAVGAQTTAYRYDALGNLLGVTLPSKELISYIVDGENRRVGKEKDGTLELGFLYDGDHIVAQLDKSGKVTSQFIYARNNGSPDYMISGGEVYRIFSDRLGSPRLVVNTSDGAIAEEIAYDEFGKVITDTNPGFQPFGFAGGLYDPDTKLVRFGARDYDPATGRWTAKDPIKFAGGDTNLYGYASEDPVNHVDPSGLGGCQKVKKMVKDAVKQNGKKIPLVKGPVQVNLRTDKPAVEVSTGAQVEVDGQKVAELQVTDTVGITPTANPRSPLIYNEAEGTVTIFGHTFNFHSHTETANPNEWPTTKDLDKESSRAEGVTCGDPTDHCTGTPYTTQ